MNKTWRTYRSMLIVFLIAAFLGATVYFFWVRTGEKQVIVHQMAKFGEVVPASERIIQDRATIRPFAHAVRFARKHPGAVNISDPPFRFTLGNRQYYLWVGEQNEKGTLMKLPDTHTVYTIGKPGTRRLTDILLREYGE